MKPTPTKNITRFKGLNNVSDPLRLPLGWMTQADNINITDSYGIERRDGYARKTAGMSLTGAYNTIDFTRLYLADGGQLKRVLPDLRTNVIDAGLGSQPFYATEVNEQVYWSTGSARGIIMPDDSVRAWDWVTPAPVDLAPISGPLPAGQYRVVCTFLFPDGRETGAGDASAITLPAGSGIAISNIEQRAGFTTLIYVSPADSTSFYFYKAVSSTNTVATYRASPDELGMELTNMLLDAAPAGSTQPTFWQGRMHVMTYDARQNMTTVWRSEPLGYHLFNLNEGFISVPGRGLMLAATRDAMVIGTDKRIFAVSPDYVLTQLADYGVVPGRQWAIDHGENDEQSDTLLIWTTRGLCSAPAFSNLTLRQISVDSGASAGAAVIRQNGAKRFVVALQKGGTAFNPRT